MESNHTENAKELKKYALHAVTPKWKGEGNSVEADGHTYEKGAKLKEVIEHPDTIADFNVHSHRSCQRYYEIADTKPTTKEDNGSDEE